MRPNSLVRDAIESILKGSPRAALGHHDPDERLPMMKIVGKDKTSLRFLQRLHAGFKRLHLLIDSDDLTTSICIKDEAHGGFPVGLRQPLNGSIVNCRRGMLLRQLPSRHSQWAKCFRCAVCNPLEIYLKLSRLSPRRHLLVSF